MQRKRESLEFKMNLVASRFRAKDWGGVGAAFMMGAFACIALVRWRESGELFFILLFFRDILAAYYFFGACPQKIVPHIPTV